MTHCLRYRYCLLAVLVLYSCSEEPKLFKLLEPTQTGIHFINKITEDDSINILASEYVYNGAGVAIADVNGDGLQDLFFAGNQVENKLYLNKGNLQFEDITIAAGITKPDMLNWSSGVNIVDVNNDGLMDVYICNTMSNNAAYRKNLLYIHQGNDEDGLPRFLEASKAYGLDSDTYSSHAQFFDYDNDGDLDVFIGVNQIYNNNPNQYAEPIVGEEAISRDRLFRNDMDQTRGHPVFKDISSEAGILHNGYSHSSLIHDFNDDGWQDIYVANDYISNDLVFINNQDGTFTNKANEIFKHFSLSAMGSDVGDINNDGKADFITSEMQPYYNKRKKLFHGESSYTAEILRKNYNHAVQYTRNTLQLNLGNNPENDLPIYGDIGIMANVKETDWSWATLFADYDNDGWQDVFIANGFPKDVTDRDFSEFRIVANRLMSEEQLIAAIPEVKTPNFMYRNKGDLTFEDVSEDWGLKMPSFSNGAAYGDLDNDGDLDLVTNNINDSAFIFENTAGIGAGNYMRIQLVGEKGNASALGSKVLIYFSDKVHVQNVISGRGYLSQSEHTLHFGLGSATEVDSVFIVWPRGQQQKVEGLEVNKTHEIQFGGQSDNVTAGLQSRGIYKEISVTLGITHLDKDPDFIDFNIQRTIPHKLSQYGPALAVGDVNSDGLDDLFVGGGYEQDETWFLQTSDGNFISTSVSYKTELKKEEDVGTLLFDADGDGDLDLYIVRGSAQFPDQHELYQDILLKNDGQGNFVRDLTAIPDIRASGSCVKAADMDQDGDLDLFVGSRVKPGSYPDVGRSYILENQSTGNQIKFVENTVEELYYPGMVSDAIWTDINNDNWPDLIIACEWKPIQVFINRNGTLEDITGQTGLQDYKGWWNSLKSADMDNDGDMDFIAGNFGDNTYFKCSTEEPIRIYGKDFDSNGSIDALLSCMWVDSLGEKHEYPYHPYMDMGKQVVSMRKKFANYGEYGEASMAKILEDENLDEAILMSANYMKTSWIENLGGGKFSMHPLSVEAQFAPVYGIQCEDYNKDGAIDVLLIGNDHGVEVQQGRADASIGLVLRNEGNGQLSPLSINESHFYVPGDGRSLVNLNLGEQRLITIASQNKDSIRVFESVDQSQQKVIRLTNEEVRCDISLKNGDTQRRDFYWGDSFQSQSSRAVVVTPAMQSIKIYNGLGEETRAVEF